MYSRLTRAAIDTGDVGIVDPVSTTKLLKDTIDLLSLCLEVQLVTETTEECRRQSSRSNKCDEALTGRQDRDADLRSQSCRCNIDEQHHSIDPYGHTSAPIWPTIEYEQLTSNPTTLQSSSSPRKSHPHPNTSERKSSPVHRGKPLPALDRPYSQPLDSLLRGIRSIQAVMGDSKSKLRRRRESDRWDRRRGIDGRRPSLLVVRRCWVEGWDWTCGGGEGGYRREWG